MLFWERRGSVSEDYHIFVHLLDEDDQIWGQHDGLPLLGSYPCSQWADGLLLPDPHDVRVSPDIPPGKYRLVAGMYRWPSLERLPAFRYGAERWLNDAVVLAELGCFRGGWLEDGAALRTDGYAGSRRCDRARYQRK
jgi:hypothetical protein